jgi:Ricin-type beta-trefoil lectin domain
LQKKEIQEARISEGKETTMKEMSSLMVVLARLLLCIMLMGTWPQKAQAELSDDPLPPTKAADCEKESGEWKKVMCGVQNIVGFAQKISSVYSGFKGTFDAATFLGRVLGILDNEVNLKDELDRLHQHLDNLGAALDKRMVRLHQVDQLALNQQLVHTAAQNNRLGMPFNQNTDGVNVAAGYVRAAMDDQYFQRLFMGSVDPATDGETRGAWKKVISDRANPDSDGFVYDWRVGVPQLLQLIALRLAILPVIDPNFAKDQVFKEDFLDYWETLHEHYDKMIDGVRCGVHFEDHWRNYNEGRLGYTDVTVACADIYTGLAATSNLQVRDYPYYQRPNNTCYYITDDGTRHGERHSCGEAFDAFWQNFHNNVLPPLMEALHPQVLLKLPLFEMQSMMGLLSLYAYGERDLTEKYQRIPVYEASHLCLDTEWGRLAAGTNVMLWECNGSNGQKWIYDRRSGTISNPPSGKCLDVQWGNSAPGTPVWIWDCNGSDAQKWTYDRETHVLQNALGTVLDIQWGKLEAGTQVWSWPQGGSALWSALLTAVWTGQREINPSPGWRADQELPRRGRTPVLPQM